MGIQGDKQDCSIQLVQDPPFAGTADCILYEEQMMQECAVVEKKAAELIKEGKREEALTLMERYTQKMASATAKTWEDLKADLWQIFARGF